MDPVLLWLWLSRACVPPASPPAQLPQALCPWPIHLSTETNPQVYCTYPLFTRNLNLLLKRGDYSLEDCPLLVPGTQHCLNHLPQTVFSHRPCYLVVPDSAEHMVFFQNVHTALELKHLHLCELRFLYLGYVWGRSSTQDAPPANALQHGESHIIPLVM